jgi:5,5'-dehydrodivanillate O-demethylase oxygenase subunit
MLTKEENERLTRVGPGTPCGNLLRRYWQPLCPASELPDEKPAKRVKLLGEELVVFRDMQGNYGCLAEHCSHRGTSLYYGFVEDCGIRCAYHGWKYAPDGRCLEQPFEPPGSTYKDRIQHTAYPVEKLAGLLFAYLGPPERKPLLPRWDVLVREDGTRRIEIRPPLDCSWLQAEENTADTTHTYYLHGHMMHTKGLKNGQYYYRPIVKYDWQLCEWGVEKRCFYGGDEPEEEIRPPLLFPNMLRIPTSTDETLHWRVPIDDTHTNLIIMFFTPSPNGRKLEQPEEPLVRYQPSGIGPNGEWDLTTFNAQDAMAWVTQGPIFDRSQEHLGASDRGIVLFRKLLADQIKIVEEGGDPIALVRDPAKNRIIAFHSGSARHEHAARTRA